MKQRLVTLGLAAGALLLFYLLLFNHSAPRGESASQPTSLDAGPDGLQGMWRWLQSSQVPLSSLRYRYDRLAVQPGVAEHGNLLITVMPHSVPIRRNEWRPLRAWIEAGNTVLVLAALDDTPPWSLMADNSVLSELADLTHISFSPEPVKKEDSNDASDTLRRGLQAALGNPKIEVQPQGEHPLLDKVHAVVGSTALLAARWISQPLQAAMPLKLLRRADSGAPVMWLSRQGEGQLIVTTLVSPFTNQHIEQADNAQLLANIIAWARAPAGAVIFDDAHQGLTDYYDPKALYADPRLYHTLLWLVLLWLAFVLGPLPLRRAFSVWKPVDETMLVNASGRFYSAVVTPTDAAQRLLENFFNQLRRRLNLVQDGAPLWEWLAARSSVSDQERTALQQLFARAQAGERVELIRLQNLLSDIQGKVV